MGRQSFKKIQILWGLLIIQLSAVACTLIDRNKQYVAVDSVPRGLTIHQEGVDETLGVTPAYVLVRRGAKLNLSFSKDHHEAGAWSEACKIRYWESLGDGLFAWSMGSIYYVPLVWASTLYIGYAFECQPEVLFKSEALAVTPQTNDVEYCRSYLIVPPTGVSEEFSNQMTKVWKESNLFRLRGCDHFVSPSRTMSALSILNFNYKSNFEVESFPKQGLLQLSAQSQATHIVVLKTSQVSPSHYKARSQVTDILSQRDESESHRNFQEVESEVSEATVKGRFKILDIFVPPNSIAYGTVNDNDIRSKIYSKNGYQLRDVTKASNLWPKFLNNLRYASIDHSYGKRHYSLNWSLFPSFGLTWEDYYVDAANDAGTEAYLEREKIQLINFALRGGFTFFTPWASFQMGAGPGLSSGRSIQDDGEITTHVIPTVSLFFGAYRFLTSSIYGQLGYDFDFPVTKHEISGVHHNYRVGREYAFLGAGVYLPVIKSR